MLVLTFQLGSWSWRWGRTELERATLLSIVAGLMGPARGTVEINGLRRRASEEVEIQIRKQLAFLPDQPWLAEFKTGREWLMAVGRLYDIDFEHLSDHISRLFELFHLTENGDSPIRTVRA
jgi:ABC-type multidrug transport system ATPase subunit